MVICKSEEQAVRVFPAGLALAILLGMPTHERSNGVIYKADTHRSDVFCAVRALIIMHLGTTVELTWEC